MCLRARGLDVAKVLDIDLVDLGKVVNVGEEDVDLDDLFEAGAGGLEDGAQVLDALVLFGGAVSRENDGARWALMLIRNTYRTILDGPRDVDAGGVLAGLARAEDEAIGLDGLAVDRGGRGRLVGDDGFLGHGCEGERRIVG